MPRIIVFSDGETWEEMNEYASVVDLTPEGWKELSDGGAKARHLKPRHIEAGWTVGELLEGTGVPPARAIITRH